MNKKLSCHCGGVEAQVKVPESGFKKVMRCNCTLCKRKGYIIGVLGENDFTLIKGKELFFPIRFAIWGDVHGPDIGLIIKILGKQKTLDRLKKGINYGK